MQVKVFEASDMNSGLKMVKEDLGPDALILSTRTLRSGKLGMLGKPILEITAAIDSPWPEKQAHKEPPRQRNFDFPDQQEAQDSFTYQNLWAQKPSDELQEPENTEQPASHGYSRPPELSHEINELKNIIDGLSRRIGSLDTTPISRPYIEPEYEDGNAEGISDSVTQLLLSRGINHRVAGLVARFTHDSINLRKNQINGLLSEILTEAIAKLFTVACPLDARLTRQKRISLIGPTGVGKTTTVAKLAAGYLNRFGGKVALITIDTYRIAAVEQLKVYGEIMNLPVEVVIKPQDMAKALNRHSDCELILIDTAGRSPGNTMELHEMTSFLRPEYGLENHLLLSATNREAELETIIHRFSCLPIANFIFSKVDECSLLGVLLNIHYSQDTPISYLTNGQRVPEDIIAPDPQTLADFIMNPQKNRNNG